MDKETVAKILAFVEKNCTEVEEIEEYLWRLLDKGIDNRGNESMITSEDAKKLHNKIVSIQEKQNQSFKLAKQLLHEVEDIGELIEALKKRL